MKKISKILILALAFVMIFCSIPTSAAESYETYTYSIDGLPLESPTAYAAEEIVTELDMKLPAGEKDVTISDIVCNDGDVYLADRDNNRIIVLDKYYSLKTVINSYVDETGVTRTFNGPNGIFVTDSEVMVDGTSYLYVWQGVPS